MVKVNKYLICIQLFILSLIGQNIIQCAARIQTEQSATNIDLELIQAVYNGNKKKVEQLIEAGANVDVIDKYGWTALTWAAWNGAKQMVELLIKAKADVNITGENGLTALISAAGFGYKKIVELLLKAGANIEHKNKSGEKAIDYAKICYYHDILKLLENEPLRREVVVKKFIENNQIWIKENLGKKIKESTSEQLFSDITNIIAEYCSIEYTDIPLEYRLNN